MYIYITIYIYIIIYIQYYIIVYHIYIYNTTIDTLYQSDMPHDLGPSHFSLSLAMFSHV